MKKIIITLCSVTLLALGGCKREEAVQPTPADNTVSSENIEVANNQNLSPEALPGPSFVPIVIAGKNNTFGYVNGIGQNARFNKPTGIFVNKDGALLVADAGNNAIRKIGNGAVVSTIVKSNKITLPIDLAANNDGAIAVLSKQKILFFKDGHFLPTFNNCSPCELTGIDNAPNGEFFWYTNEEFKKGVPFNFLSSIRPNLNVPVPKKLLLDSVYTTSLDALPNGDKFFTIHRGIFEYTAAGHLNRILPKVNFGDITDIAVTRDQNKIFIVEDGDIVIITKPHDAKFFSIKVLIANIKATSIALSNSEKVLFFTSAQHHTVSKINLQ